MELTQSRGLSCAGEKLCGWGWGRRHPQAPLSPGWISFLVLSPCTRYEGLAPRRVAACSAWTPQALPFFSSSLLSAKSQTKITFDPKLCLFLEFPGSMTGDRTIACPLTFPGVCLPASGSQHQPLHCLPHPSWRGAWQPSSQGVCANFLPCFSVTSSQCQGSWDCCFHWGQRSCRGLNVCLSLLNSQEGSQETAETEKATENAASRMTC